MFLEETLKLEGLKRNLFKDILLTYNEFYDIIYIRSSRASKVENQ